MECPACGADNSASAKFCDSCGASLAPACPACGHRNRPSSRFCMECGAPLAAPARPGGPSAGPPSASPESYTRPGASVPQHLAERILATRDALEGERKQVTVLFADVAGSTELIRDRDPEEAQALLEPALHLMMGAVHRYEGMVNRVLGDGIMALFGAPLAQEDHAVRACHAALAIQAAMGDYAADVRRRAGVEPRVRIGLNSGEIVVRAIGDDLRMEYSAMGQTTHLAARMEQAAPPGHTLLTAETLRLAEGYVQARALGPVPVRGLAEPVEAYQLVGTGPIRTRLQASAARGLTRFVGRQDELAALLLAQTRAGAGHGQVVAVLGEPGVGKSRLVHELTRSPSTRGWLILKSSSASYEQASSYRPVIELLKAYFQVDDHDDGRQIQDKVTAKLGALEEALGSVQPAVLSLLDVPVDDPEWRDLDPPQRRRRTLDAVKRLLLWESQTRPLLLVVEDLHWLDAETRALLDHLVDSLPTARILLLVTYRPEYRHGWGTRSSYSQLRLDPLPPASADELLRALLGDEPALDPLKQLLIERTEGNPFFLEESVRALVETGALVGERAAYRLVKPLASIHVPATVQAILAARVDRLRAEDKRLLQSAAVIGKDVPYALLHAIADLSEEELAGGLARLQAAELLYEASLFPDPEFTFKHVLTRDVAYDGLLRERRRALHARIVEAIEVVHADRLAEQVDRLAHHALRGEAWTKAVAYCRQAGTRAMARSAYREAVAYIEQALLALEHLPKCRETLEQAIDLRLDLRSSLQPLGEIGRILDHLEEAEGIAERLGDRRRLGRVSSLMANVLWWMGQPDRAVDAGWRALTIDVAPDDVPFRVVTNSLLGLAYWGRGDYGQAIERLEPNVAFLEGDRLRERFGLPIPPAIIARGYVATCLAELGEFAEGIAHGEEAVRIAEEVNLPYGLTDACVLVGSVYIRRGDLGRAIPALERAIGLCRTWDFPYLLPWAAAGLGAAYTLAERVADAVPLLEQAVEQAASSGLVLGASLRAARLSEAHLAAGRTDDAVHLAGQALDLAIAHKERAHQAWALRLLGEVAARGDPLDADRAEGSYRRALGLADELGMRPLQAHCHLGLGTLYRRAGRPEQARAELSSAVELYRSMQMALWLQRAEAELAAASAAPSTSWAG